MVACRWPPVPKPEKSNRAATAKAIDIAGRKAYHAAPPFKDIQSLQMKIIFTTAADTKAECHV